MSVPLGLVVPNMPHPLLVPEQNPGWAAVRAGYEAARRRIEESGADLLVLYSTGWPSVIGHQLQADPEPQWVHVDQDWHMLGSIPYRFRMDAAFAAAYQRAATRRGLHARTVAWRGFPIDTGSIVALKLLNPDNRLPATIVSCNMYADRAETLVLGKSARDAIEKGGRKAVLIAVTALSTWIHPRPVPPEKDRISSLQDDEWNRKLLELFGEGRLEDVAQLARTFTAQAHADSKLKGIWWLAAAMGQHNRYLGTVHAYAPVQGTGAAVVSLVPTDREAAGHEFDEEDVERYQGDRDVMGGGDADDDDEDGAPAAAAVLKAKSVPAPLPAAPLPVAPSSTDIVHVAGAPKPVGAYPHARKVGDLLFLSGVGPRDPATNAVPGGPVRDAEHQPLPYDAEAQTRATIENVKHILEGAGSSLDRVLDVTAFLIDMDRDFAAYNKVYAEYFTGIGATRTTLAISALPTPIAVELKVIAAAGRA